MPERVLEMIGGWRKIPDTYFRHLGLRTPGNSTNR